MPVECGQLCATLILNAMLAGLSVGGTDTGVDAHPSQTLQSVGQPIQTFVQPLSPAHVDPRLTWSSEPPLAPCVLHMCQRPTSTFTALDAAARRVQ